MMAPLMRTLLEMRVFIFTIQFAPTVEFFNDVFSAIVALSATAQSVICVHRTLLIGDTNAGVFDGKIFCHSSKI